MVLREKVYEIIKERIISGVYRPGDPLNEKEIIEELNVSRTPFREAINALNEVNLVQIYANRGIFVREISAKDISNIFDIRYQLEPYVCQLACRYMPDSTIFMLRERSENVISHEYQEILAEDDYFHKCLLEYTDNNQLIKIMSNLYEQNSLQKVVFDATNNFITEKRKEAASLSVVEHLEILDSIERRDDVAAGDATRKHLVLARQRSENYQ